MCDTASDDSRSAEVKSCLSSTCGRGITGMLIYAQCLFNAFVVLTYQREI